MKIYEVAALMYEYFFNDNCSWCFNCSVDKSQKPFIIIFKKRLPYTNKRWNLCQFSGSRKGVRNLGKMTVCFVD